MVVRKTKTPEIPNIDKQAGNARILVIAVFILTAVIIYIYLQAQSEKVTLIDNHAKEMREAQVNSDKTLHAAQEEMSYQYADQKNRANQMKTACDQEVMRHQSLKVWLGQKGIKPPAEYMPDVSCSVVIEKEK